VVGLDSWRRVCDRVLTLYDDPTVASDVSMVEVPFLRLLLEVSLSAIYLNQMILHYISHKSILLSNNKVCDVLSVVLLMELIGLYITEWWGVRIRGQSLMKRRRERRSQSVTNIHGTKRDPLTLLTTQAEERWRAGASALRQTR